MYIFNYFFFRRCVNKQQVRDFQELGTQSSRIKGCAQRKDWACFNKSDVSGSFREVIILKVYAWVQEPPQLLPWALFALGVGMKRGQSTIWGSRWNVLWCRVAVIAHLPSRPQREEERLHVWKNRPPALGWRPLTSRTGWAPIKFCLGTLELLSSTAAWTSAGRKLSSWAGVGR